MSDVSSINENDNLQKADLLLFKKVANSTIIDKTKDVQLSISASSTPRSRHESHEEYQDSNKYEYEHQESNRDKSKDSNLCKSQEHVEDREYKIHNNNYEPTSPAQSTVSDFQRRVNDLVKKQTDPFKDTHTPSEKSDQSPLPSLFPTGSLNQDLPLPSGTDRDEEDENVFLKREYLSELESLKNTQFNSDNVEWKDNISSLSANNSLFTIKNEVDKQKLNIKKESAINFMLQCSSFLFNSIEFANRVYLKNFLHINGYSKTMKQHLKHLRGPFGQLFERWYRKSNGSFSVSPWLVILVIFIGPLLQVHMSNKYNIGIQGNEAHPEDHNIRPGPAPTPRRTQLGSPDESQTHSGQKSNGINTSDILGNLYNMFF